MYKLRQEKVFEYMKDKQIRQLLIYDPLCIFYLTGKYIEPDERFICLLFKSNVAYFFVNRLFEVKDETLNLIEFTDYDNPISLIGTYLEKHPLYVDKLFPAGFLVPIIHSSPITDVFITNMIDELRLVKDEQEVYLMKESSKINDEAMIEIAEYLQVGVTEKEIEQKLLEIYISKGASGFSFDPIVSFGKNTSDTHHIPDCTPLKEGDCIMLDIGCKKEMYCSDMTRMYFYGYNPDSKQKEIFDLVLKAYETGEKMCKPGVRLCDIDKACRTVIEKAGYGNCFKHRTGHMIGLETHDFGEVSQVSELVAKPGMIFSIEPTIMLEEYTIHFENLVLITENGYEVLNHVSKEMMIL